MWILQNTRIYAANTGWTRPQWVWFSLLLLFLGGCVGSLAERANQPCPSSIPAPTLQVGDTWRWEEDQGGQKTYRLVSQTEEGLFGAASRPGEPQLFFDHSHTLRKVLRDGQWITQSSVDYPRLGKPLLEFPLHSGKSWSDSYLAKAPTSGGILAYNRSFTVVGCEQVSVPAGSFLAVIIEETNRITGYPGASRTWWYAPDVKYFVKVVHGRLSSYPAAWESAKDWVLISYQLAARPVPQSRESAGLPPTSGSSPGEPPRAMTPMWHKGYEWKYRWESPRGSGTFVWSMAGEEEIEGVGYYVLKSGTRDIYYKKEDFAWLMERVAGAVELRASPAYRLFAWPLIVGLEWETTHTWENLPERRSEDLVRRHKVKALETVAVPAGTFQAYHLISTDRAGVVLAEYWYSPKVKWLIRERSYFSYGVRERELMEYRLPE